jgi:hypothetical protein
MPAGVAVVPARSRSEITNFNSLLHSGVTKALALPSKTQRGDSRQRSCTEELYAADWKSLFVPCESAWSVQVAIRQVTP